MELSMRRLLTVLPTACSLLLSPRPRRSRTTAVRAPTARPTTRSSTNAGFIVIAFFPLFIFVMSMLQWRLDKRKERAQGRRQVAAPATQAWRGGW